MRRFAVLALTACAAACGASPTTQDAARDVVADASDTVDDAPDASRDAAREGDAPRTDAAGDGDAATVPDADASAQPPAGWTLPSLHGTPFASSSSQLAARADEFFQIYTVAEGPAGRNGNRFGGSPAWVEWDSIQFAWTAHGPAASPYRAYVMGRLHDERINGFVDATGAMVHGEQPAGYVWSWGGTDAVNERWYDPHGHLDQPTVRSFHFDQQPRMIAALSSYAMWTRDRAYLAFMLPRAEGVMDYLLTTMRGRADGVVADPGLESSGVPDIHARPTTYMDQLTSGYQDGWTNAAFYTALRAMADLEALAGRTPQQRDYAALAAAMPARFESTFWNPATQRYAGWRDAHGTQHDAGYTHVNLEALARGLGTADHAQRIFDWLAAPAQAVTGGPHRGSTDVYQEVFAPRSSTAIVPLGDWDPWSDPGTGRFAYGSHDVDGGALLWVEYYDVLARLRYQDADAALRRYDAMLLRCASDSHFLTFSPPSRMYDDFGEGLGEVATSSPFAESGIAAMPFLTGFVGASPTVDGLRIAPALPADLLDAQVTDLEYAGRARTLFVARGYTVLEGGSDSSPQRLPAGGTLSQTFVAPASFDELAVQIGTYGSTTSGFTLTVERQQTDGGYVPVGARRFADVQDNRWVHLAVPSQPAGTHYRLTMSDALGSIAWYRDEAHALAGGAAMHNGAALSGAFRMRAIVAPQTVLLDQQAGETADRLTTSLGQTFATTAPFDRVSLRVGTYRATDAGFTATLSRDVGGRWAPMQSQSFQGVADNSEVVVGFATQPAGRYLLEISAPVAGVAWYRTAHDAIPGAGIEASTNGVAVAGDRWLRIERGQYRVRVPEDHVDTVIPAGAAYVLAP